MKYVLFRSGKVDIIGPFDNISQAAEMIADGEMLGYQILPLKSPPQEELAFPVSHQTDGNFYAWAIEFPWSDASHELVAGEFMTCAVKKFPKMFELVYDSNNRRGPWYMNKKVELIQGLRKFFGENGVSLGLKVAKDLVDDYEDVMRESK